MKRTEPRAPRTELLPYSIDVVCLDQSGIVAGLSGFFASRGIDIAEVSTRSYPAAHTGAQMFAVQMIINVPERLHAGAPARGIHGLLRFAESRRHPRAGEVVVDGCAEIGKKLPVISAAALGRHALENVRCRRHEARDLLLPEGHDRRLHPRRPRLPRPACGVQARKSHGARHLDATACESSREVSRQGRLPVRAAVGRRRKGVPACST